MARAGTYKQRKVTREFWRVPRWAEREIAWCKKKGRAIPTHAIRAKERAIEMECGHTKPDPLWVYRNEVANMLKLMSRALSRKEVRRCRCYECASISNKQGIDNAQIENVNQPAQ